MWEQRLRALAAQVRSDGIRRSELIPCGEVQKQQELAALARRIGDQAGVNTDPTEMPAACRVKVTYWRHPSETPL